jgi:hypothetical protein
MKRISRCEDIALDEPAVGFEGRRIPPVVDVEEDVGIDVRMAADGNGVFAIGRIRLRLELLLSREGQAAEQENP